MKRDLSIIVPCLNEESNIEFILNQLKSLFIKNDLSGEVIVIDDKSDDNTFNITKSWIKNNPEISVICITKELNRRGYGAVLKYGLPSCNGEYVTFVSADAVDPIYLIPEMLSKLKNDNYDLVQCSRYLDKNDSTTIPFKYKFFQFFFRIGVRLALNKYIPDSTYAFKVFDRKKIMALGISSNRFNISPEIMFKAILANYSIYYIKGAQGIRKSGISKFNFYKEGPGFGICLIRAFLHRNKILYWF